MGAALPLPPPQGTLGNVWRQVSVIIIGDGGEDATGNWWVEAKDAPKTASDTGQPPTIIWPQMYTVLRPSNPDSRLGSFCLHPADSGIAVRQ